MPNNNRSYLEEALAIIHGETAMLAQKQHLLAIWYNIGRLAEQVVERRERERKPFQTPEAAMEDNPNNNPELRG